MQLEHIGFDICSKTIFQAPSNNNISDKGFKSKFNSIVDNKTFMITSKNLKIKKQLILFCEQEINNLLNRWLPFFKVIIFTD